MAESKFSWLKVASFIGALVLVILAIVTIANGIMTTVGGDALHGVFSIAGGLVCGACAVWAYKNYQKKSDESRYGHS
jgi:hypothetical protein